MKKYINKRDIKLIGITLIAGLFLGWLFFYSSNNNKVHNHEEHTEAEETVYTCSMHPQIKQNKPGLCPICAMDLVPLEAGSVEGEHVDPNEIQMTESALALASVQTTIVKKGIPEKNVHLSGKVKADERRMLELTARYGGRIEELFINYTGQRVRKGQKLGTIYSPELITAQKELLEAAMYQSSNPSFYKASRTKLKLWNLSDEQIDAILDKGEPKTYFDILSPISGTVIKRHVAIGDYIKEGSALFKVVDLSKVWVMFDAYESDLPWISKGDVIDFTIQSIPGEKFSAKVSYVDPFIDAQTRVAQVRVEINNPKQILKPEMFTRGILKSNIAEETKDLLVPKSSILWTGKRAVVYVKVPDRETASFIHRQITLGAEAGNFYVVTEGLSEGEEIATNGVFKIDAAAQLAGKSSMMNPTHNMASEVPDGGQLSTGHEHHTMQLASFQVSGNCSMCKTTIETSAKAVPGVNTANWNIETKELQVSYNNELSSLSDIHKAIARSGYDTERETAPKEVYDKLPPCCKYTRSGEVAREENIQHETFKVAGNCGMCKETIETSVKGLDGVKEADWNKETKMIHVAFNSNQVKLSEIHKAIAKVGYDTELEKADDKVYDNLHACCKYPRE